jgi:hypothetical protein
LGAIFLPYKDDRRDLPGGNFGRFIWGTSMWPNEYVGDTSYVKYYASWNGQYHAIHKDVTRAFGRLY